MRREISRWAIGGFAVLLSSLAFSASAGAATLAPVTDHYFGWTDAVYVAGSEANHVTLGGALRRVYVLRDPNVTIATPAFALPYVNPDTNRWNPLLGEDRSIYASFNCVAPTGKGQGVCVSTPGDTCNDSGCYFHEDVSFHVARLVLGGGNDAATLLLGSGPVQVSAGSGDDTLDTRNGAVDQVDCGDGADSVATDGHDSVSATCERVTRGRV